MKSLLTALLGAWLLAQPGLSRAEPEPPPGQKLTYLLIYRPGPAWPQGKTVAELPLREHGNYMLGLYAKGSMKLAGPLTDNAGGAVVLEVADDAEARAIVANDPAVKAGLFVHELHPWAPVAWEKFLRK